MILIVILLSVFLGLRSLVRRGKDQVWLCNERAVADDRHSLSALASSHRALLIALEVLLVAARRVRSEHIALVDIMVSASLLALALS